MVDPEVLELEDAYRRAAQAYLQAAEIPAKRKQQLMAEAKATLNALAAALERKA